jgi:hypothetical protein
VLAELGPEVAIPRRGGPPYRFRGGHRLWASPEMANVTYALEDHGCEVTGDDGSIVVSAPADAAGVSKEVEVTLDGDELVVEHRLVTDSPEALAAWGITQFPMGGTALLSMRGSGTAPLPDRSIVLWPYTSPDDPRLTLARDVALIAAAPGDPLKLGVGPGPRRLGYLRDGSLFVKDVGPAHDVPDRGAVAQVYVGQGFCELEGLGGRPDPDGDGVATMTERWALVECPDLGTARAIVAGDASA